MSMRTEEEQEITTSVLKPTSKHESGNSVGVLVSTSQSDSVLLDYGVESPPNTQRETDRTDPTCLGLNDTGRNDADAGGSHPSLPRRMIVAFILFLSIPLLALVLAGYVGRAGLMWLVGLCRGDKTEERIPSTRQPVTTVADSNTDEPRRLYDLGCLLFQKFEATDNMCNLEAGIAAVRDAVRLTLDGNVNKPDYLNILGGSLWTRFKRLGSVEDIEDAISALQRAVELTPDGHPDQPRRLNNLGMSLESRFGRFGDIGDLEEAISTLRRAVGLAADNHPDKPRWLSNLGMSLECRFGRLGDIGDLEEAISTISRATELAPEGHPDKAIQLNNLGMSLRSRFIRLGDVGDIEEAISTLRRAVELTPDGHPDQPKWLNNLGMSLQSRFGHLDDVDDLEEAISVQRQAIDITFDGHPDKPKWLTNLGLSLQYRFRRLGDVGDIEEAISTQRRAVGLTPDGHPNKPIWLANLGNSLQYRYGRLGAIGDLEEAISSLLRAANLTPDGHPAKPVQLNNLGMSLESRFGRLGDISDLEEAISILRRVVELTPDGHPHKAAQLNNLGLSLSSRFGRLGNVSDLEEAILVQRQAVDITLDGHPDKPKWLTNLGLSLQSRFSRLGDIGDVEEAVSAQRRAVGLTPDGHPSKPKWLNNLGTTLHYRFGRLGDVADIEEALYALRQAVEFTPNGHPDQPKWLNNLGMSLQSRFGSLGDVGDLEEAISTQRRAVELTPDGHPDKPKWLANLALSLQHRFGRLSDVGDVEEAIFTQRQVVALAPDDHPDKPSWLYNLGISLRSRFCVHHESQDWYDSVNAFSQAAQSRAGAPTDRLQAAMNWTSLYSHNLVSTMQEDAMLAHSCVLDLIPQVVWLGHDVTRRYQELSRLDIRQAARNAAAAALTAGNPVQALEWLEQGRSIVWQQMLQLRTPVEDLRRCHPDIAADLEQTSRALQDPESSPLERIAEGHDGSHVSADAQVQARRILAIRYDEILKHIRTLAGFETFLRPKKLSELDFARMSGPVVIINVHASRCDALVLRKDDNQVIHVPLPDFSYKRAEALQATLLSVLKLSHVREDHSRRPVLCDGPDGKVDSVEAILVELWLYVVRPILAALEYLLPCAAGNELPHITWCPTGPLVFLPLHAAGIYTGGRQSVVDFAVSSYTTTLEALTPARDVVATTLATLVITQPNTGGQRPLPGTEQEAKHILAHFPRTTILEDSQATISSVLDAMGRHDCVHLACHGIQDLKDPTKSAFILHDGRLELSTLMSRSLPHTRVAFLSACQTATGDEALPEEAVHLAAGMLNAGYKSVIGTMWSIGDKDAPLVADTFYETIRRQVDNGEELRPAYALHEATKRLRTEVGETDFVKWVPFIHFGT